MGKIRIKTLGDPEEEAKEALKNQQKKEAKQAEADAEKNSTSEEIAEDQSEPEIKKTKKDKFKKDKKRSAIYSENILLVDQNKMYSISEALEILKKFKKAKFDETIELHLNTTEAGISGQMKLPHGSGKEVRVSIATDEVLAEIETGKINFDVLIAEPSQMPKLAKVAKVLGPRGLMPNPKNGTISTNPEEAMKSFQGGQIRYKTEANIPVMHLSVGKASFENNKLEENIKTVITTIKKARIVKAVLKSTMSPAIKLNV